MKSIALAVYRWHPEPPFFYGWVVLGAAGVGAFIATSVAQTVFGGVQDLIAGEMSWDRKTIALAATFGTWSSGLTMPFIGKMVDRFGPRWMMLLAALLVGFGSIYLAGAQTIWQFFFRIRCYKIRGRAKPTKPCPPNHCRQLLYKTQESGHGYHIPEQNRRRICKHTNNYGSFFSIFLENSLPNTGIYHSPTGRAHFPTSATQT